MHPSCFRCTECDKLLSAGDHFVRRDDRFVCSFHFADRKSKSSTKERTEDAQTNYHALACPAVFRQDEVRSSQPASTLHTLDNLPLDSRPSNHPLISSHFAIHHHSSQPPTGDEYSSIAPLANSMNLTADYPNDLDKLDKFEMQALYSPDYNLSPNDSNLPASAHMIDSFWTQVNSPLNEYENLDTHLDTHPYVQRKARSKRRKPQSEAGK